MIGCGLSLGGSRRPGYDLVAPAINTVLTIAEAGLGADGKCTVLFRGSITTLATGTAQSIIQIDSGSGANRYLLSAAGGTTQSQLTRTTASVGSSANVGALTAAALFSIGIAIDGAGGAIASLNGAAALSVTGGPTSGLTTFRIGAGVSGVAPIAAGSIVAVRILPGQALVAADLQAAVAAFT